VKVLTRIRRHLAGFVVRVPTSLRFAHDAQLSVQQTILGDCAAEIDQLQRAAFRQTGVIDGRGLSVLNDS
jgi:hypothetical protein